MHLASGDEFLRPDWQSAMGIGQSYQSIREMRVEKGTPQGKKLTGNVA
jgi:hypothetical protein